MLDAQRFGVDEEPCLSVRHLSKRFGAGCPHCLCSRGAAGTQTAMPVQMWHGARRALASSLTCSRPRSSASWASREAVSRRCMKRSRSLRRRGHRGRRARPSSSDGGAANLLQQSPQHQQRAIRNTVFGMVPEPLPGAASWISSLSNIAEQMIAAGNRNVEAMRARGEERSRA